MAGRRVTGGDDVLPSGRLAVAECRLGEQPHDLGHVLLRERCAAVMCGTVGTLAADAWFGVHTTGEVWGRGAKSMGSDTKLAPLADVCCAGSILEMPANAPGRRAISAISFLRSEAFLGSWRGKSASSS